MASRTVRIAAVVGALLAVSFAIHYALFGSLPVGSPAMLDDED